MSDQFLSADEANRLGALLDESKHIIVTCHVSPDGDAMGAVLAFSHYLWRKGKDAVPVVPNIFPDFLKWMPGADQVRVYEKHEAEVEPIVAAADLVVCLDFNSPDRLLGLKKPVLDLEVPKIMIDHHLDPVIRHPMEVVLRKARCGIKISLPP